MVKICEMRQEFKFKTLSFYEKLFYGIKLLYANVQCVYIVYAKYQNVSVKTMVRVDFLAYALSMHH